MPVALQSNKSLGFSFDPPLLVPSRPNGPFSQNVSRSLRIANPNVDPVAFKIKTTAPKLYVVRPNGGRIEPGESVEVQVIDQEMKEESSLDAKNSDKFLIQSMLIPEEKAAVPLHELWYLHGQEPKIVYIPPNGFPLEVEDEDESPHRMSVITDVAPDNSGRPSTHGTPGDQFSIIQEPSHPAAPPDSSALPEEPSSEDAASGVGVTNWNLYSPQPLPPPTPLVMSAPSRPDPEFVSQYKDAQEDIQWLSALLAADPDLSSVVGSSTNPAVLQERHHTSQVQTANVTVVGSEETNVSHPSLQPEGVSPQVVVTPSPIDKSPTRELSSTWLPKQSDRPTADPSATPESPITDPPSKLERRPEKSLPPIPEPYPAAEVTPARISDIVSPPESPLTEILPLPSPVTPIALESYASHPQETFIRIEMEDAVDAALPVQQSDRIEPHGTDERQLPTDTSSQREEAFMAPMIFDPHKYVTKRMNRKTKSSSNSVSIDHPSSVLMATGIPPKNVDDTSTIPLQDCMGPCEEGVAVLIADSGAMEDTSFTNSFEGVQSALGPSATEQPTFSTSGATASGTSPSNCWDVASVDVPLPPSRDVRHVMRIQTMPSGYHAAGNIDAYSSGEFFGYDTGSDELRSFPQPPTTCIDNAPRQTQPAQAGIVISSQNEDLAVHVPMGQFTSIDWQECSLPDGTRYYVNPTLHTITDVDLRNTERLNAVTRFLNGRNMEDVPPPEWELWLRDSCESTTVFIPHRAWVHHGSRMVLFERPGLRDVDKMESEYQYWLFMGSHPLHALLPSESVAKAIDVLTWFYTSPLILSSHNSASPFSQEECQELLTQLRSFSHMPSHTISLVRTRVVSTILGRVVAWRQGRRWDCATFQGSLKNNDSWAGISRTAGDAFVWSGLSNVPWNDRIILVSARDVALLVLCSSLLRWLF